MSDFGSSSNPQPGLHANPASSRGKAAWWRIRNALQNPTPGSSSWKLPMPKAWLLLLVLPVAAAIIWYATRPVTIKRAANIGAAVRNSSLLLSAGSKPKPAPGKPMLPTPPPEPSAPLPMPATSIQATQPATSVIPIQPQNLAGAAPPAPITNTVPPPPVVPAGAYPQVVYHARHDKAFGQGCSGQLTLNTTGLVFNCPNDPNGNVQVPLSQIASVDENGVQLTSGKKYHFSIPGMSKSGEEALFVSWLHHVR